MSKKLENKVAVVTGSFKGIGACIAKPAAGEPKPAQPGIPPLINASFSMSCRTSHGNNHSNGLLITM